MLAVAALFALNGNSYAQTSQSVPVLQGDPDAPGAPVIDAVQSTPLGYLIVGRGFGSNPVAVRILEDDKPLADSAVVGVSSQRISVLSIPDSSTGIVVEVDGLQSAAIQFEYRKPLEPPMTDMPIGEAPDDAEVTTANVSMLKDEAAVENDSSESVAESESDDQPVATASIPSGNVADADLSREVMVLRKRLESLEQEIYELKKLVEEQ